MALAMTRPWKHPKTGVYWIRKRVPEALRAIIGKQEEKHSLGTRDPTEAKLRLLQTLSELETKWKNLQAGPQTLSEQEAHKLAWPIHDEWIAKHRANPSDQTFWNVELGARLWAAPPIDLSRPLLEIVTPDWDSLRIFKLKERCFGIADQVLTVQGLNVDEAGRLRLAKAVSAALQRASLTLERYAKGEPESIAAGPTAGLLGGNAPAGLIAKPVSLEGLADEWAAEKRPTQKTLYEWRRVLRQLKAYLGHDDAAQIKSSDLNAWKASLVAAGLRAKTIGDAKLAPVRAILQWAVDNDRLLTNPASRVVIDVKSKPSESIRSFSEDEAKLVLKRARSERKAALRWVPWLCAYTGARVAEICQLRAEDVLQIDGIWCLRITPEAGPLKTSSSERAIPIHTAIIDEGFLDFAREAVSGPLFPKLKPDKFGSRGGNGTKIIGRWVRSLGIADPRVSPSHSWRHRLKTLARRHGLATDIVDAMVGHRRKTVADGYGEFPMEALHRELTKIPVLKLN